MKRRRFNAATAVLAAVLVFALCAGAALAAEDFKVKRADLVLNGARYAAGEILVKFRPGVDAAEIHNIHKKLNVSEVYTSVRGGFKRIKILSAATVEEMVELYRSNPAVEYAEPNYVYHAFLVPNDPYYSYQWHMPSISVGSAWDLATGYGILVGIIDTGVAYENYGSYGLAPDLAGTPFVQGYDFVNNDSHPNDDEGHGTHVTGTVTQTTNNGLGVTGVAFDCSIMPIKVLDSGGSGYVSDIADGIYYAADNGCQIINMSLGGPSSSSTLQNAVQYAYNNGVTIICAAGNAGTSTPQYPAAYAQCISVTAVRYDNTLAYYSSYGSTVDITAPGGDLTVDQNGDGYADGVLQQTFEAPNYTDWGYWFYHGTSMAAPHVTGVAAMVMEAAGGSLSPQEVRDILEGTATDLGASGWDQYYGWGKVNAYAAVVEAQGGGQNPPVANFSGTPTSGYVPLTVQFTDLSSNSPTSWSWNFGDGGTSYLQNPSHQYTSAGQFTVSLTATNAYGSDTEVKTNYITVSEPSANLMHVHDIVVTRETFWWLARGKATITIYDQVNNPVSGATVYGTFTGPVSGNKSGNTNTSGKVTFTTGWAFFPSGEWCFEVTNVTKSGWTYDPASNDVTKSCESGDVFGCEERPLAQETDTPKSYELFQNYPNPFNPVTSITFSLPKSSFVNLDVFNVKGERVTTLAAANLGPGYHTYEWNASNVASGVYFYRLQTREYVETRKMILLR